MQCITRLIFFGMLALHSNSSLIPRPAFSTKEMGLAHFGQNLGVADSGLPQIWRANQIAHILTDHVVRMALQKELLKAEFLGLMILPNEVSSNAGLQQSTHHTCDIMKLDCVFPLTQPSFQFKTLPTIMNISMIT